MIFGKHILNHLVSVAEVLWAVLPGLHVVYMLSDFSCFLLSIFQSSLV